MKTLLFGLSVSLIGMLVVFVGLVILIGSIMLIKLASTEKKTKTAQAPEEADMLPAAPAADLSVNEGISPDVLAAITAAIAAVWQSDTGFVVRHVRRVHNAPAWNRAGREDQVYSRM